MSEQGGSKQTIFGPLFLSLSLANFSTSPHSTPWQNRSTKLLLSLSQPVAPLPAHLCFHLLSLVALLSLQSLAQNHPCDGKLPPPPDHVSPTQKTDNTRRRSIDAGSCDIAHAANAPLRRWRTGSHESILGRFCSFQASKVQTGGLEGERRKNVIQSHLRRWRVTYVRHPSAAATMGIFLFLPPFINFCFNFQGCDLSALLKALLPVPLHCLHGKKDTVAAVGGGSARGEKIQGVALAEIV